MSDLPAWTRRLGPRQLQTLVTIAHTGSLSRAATLMATTQPGLSKWLRDLEDAMGVVLFERTTRRLAPTEYGHIVLRLAAQILGDTTRMADELQARQAGRLGRLNLGVLPGLAPVLLPDAIHWLQERGLEIEVVLRESTFDMLLPQLRQHQLDLLVARFDREALNAGGQRRVLFKETACIMASVDHPLQRRPTVDWTDLADQPWILPVPDSPMRRTVERAFERAGMPVPRSLLESASALTNRAMARKMGVLFITSRLSASELERDGTVRRLPLTASQPSAVGVLWMVNDLAPQQQYMLEALEAAARLHAEAAVGVVAETER